MLSRDTGAREEAESESVEGRVLELDGPMLWSMGPTGRGVPPREGPGAGVGEEEADVTTMTGVARGVARGVVEPELLLPPEMLLLSDFLLLAGEVLSSAFFLPLELSGVLGGDIVAVCKRGS